MSNASRNSLRTRTEQTVSDAAGNDGGTDGLAADRSDVDRLMLLAEGVLRETSQHDSQDFLRNSRQTGGE